MSLHADHRPATEPGPPPGDRAHVTALVNSLPDEAVRLLLAERPQRDGWAELADYAANYTHPEATT